MRIGGTAKKKGTRPRDLVPSLLLRSDLSGHGSITLVSEIVRNGPPGATDVTVKRIDSFCISCVAAALAVGSNNVPCDPCVNVTYAPAPGVIGLVPELYLVRPPAVINLSVALFGTTPSPMILNKTSGCT